MRRILSVVAVLAAVVMSVACSTSSGNGEFVMGEGTITYNTDVEEIASAFCQADEDMTVLYFSASKVSFDKLDDVPYYVKVSLDTVLADGASLDIAKGEAVVELIDVANENELKATSGSVSVKSARQSTNYKVLLNAALDDSQSVVAVEFEGGCVNGGAIAYANEWSFVTSSAGVSTSIIWEAFLDMRSSDMYYVYLAPIKDISFEEVSYYSPVKISLPANFPLDGSRVCFSENSSVSVSYGPNLWDGTNSPNGSVKLLYNEARSSMNIRFATDGLLKGYYGGAVTVVK